MSGWKKVLTDAAAIGNTAARAISYFPRDPGNMLYGKDSSWIMAYASKDTAFLKDGAFNLEARALFHFGYIVVSPAMAVTVAGKGSDYALIALDSKKQALDGSKYVQADHAQRRARQGFLGVDDVRHPNPLATPDRSAVPDPRGARPKGIKTNADGSYDIYFAPKPPKGKEGNWLQTVPGKSWWLALRIYGPLKPWIDQSWRPGEIELVE